MGPIPQKKEVFRQIDDVFDSAQECLGKRDVFEARNIWDSFTMKLNEELPSGSEVRDEVLGYCGDLTLMMEGRIDELEKQPVVAEVKLSPEEIKKSYEQARQRMEDLKGVVNLLTLGPTKIQVKKELDTATKNYVKLRSEYIGAISGELIEAKVNAADEELNRRMK